MKDLSFRWVGQGRQRTLEVLQDSEKELHMREFHFVTRVSVVNLILLAILMVPR